MKIWKPLVSECLQCEKEPTNEVDKNVVTVVGANSHCKEEVVSRVQQNMFMTAPMFLSLPHCTLDIFATWKRVDQRGDYGLETPVNKPHFHRPKKAIKLTKK